MTDTGQVPGEGLPENAGMVEQPGVPGAYTYLSETTTEDDDLLLLPGAQSPWGNEVAPPVPEPVVETVHEPGPHEMAGRDSGSHDLSAVRMPNPAQATAPPRRPLHLGPPIPDTSASPVRSLADRGAVGAPVRQSGPPTTGPEYLDVPQARETPQAAAPWGSTPVQGAVQAPVAPQAPAAETVVPAAEPVGVAAHSGEPMAAAHAAVSHSAAEAVAVTAPGEVPPSPDASLAPQGYEGEPAGQVPAPAPVQPETAATFGGDAVPAEPYAQAPGPWPQSPQEPEGGQLPEGVQTADVAQVPGDAQVPEGAQVPEAGQAPEAAQSVESAPASEGVQSPKGVQLPEGVQGPEAELAAEVAQAAESAPTPEGVETPEAAQAPGDVQAAPEVTPAPEAAQAAESAPVPEGEQSSETAQAPEGVQPPTDVQTPQPDQLPETLPVPDAEQAPVADQPPVAGPLEDPALAPDPTATPTAEQSATAVAAAQDAQAPAPDHTTEVAATDALSAPGEMPEAAPAPDAPQGPEDMAATADPAPDPDPATEQMAAAAQEAAPAQAPAPAPEDGQDAEFAHPAEAETATTPEPADATPVSVPPPGVDPTPAVDPGAPDTAVQDMAPAPEVPEAPEAAPVPQPEDALAAPGDAEPLAAAAHAEPIAPEQDQAPVAEEQPTPAVEPPAQDPLQAQGPQLAPDTQPEQLTAPTPAAAEPTPPHPEFVPVEGGSVPTTPHLAPTPPHATPLPAQEPAPVPAPRDGDPEVVQNADDLDTRAADQEDRAVQQPGGEVDDVRQPAGPAAPPYDDAERAAVLKVMRERRDIRNGFRSDPIPHEVLLRVLEAAHTAPSVGHSQPWDFVVIRSAETRQAMHELAARQRDAYAKSLPKGRAKQFKELKIEAILDTPVNIVVTADPTRGGRHTLGRHTQPQMAPYSAALAVENLWLAARAEGLGVGWVSFFDEREMVRALGLPEHLEVIAYLCVGYVDEFPEEPELMQAGWSKRRPLSWVVHEETYGRRALPGEEPHDLLGETVAQIRPLDAKALGEAWERQKRMTKPPGSLGMLEIISAQLSGLSRQCPPPIPEPAAVAIFAGDHGVHAQGVTPWPQEVTAQMVANFLGGGAVCNAFAGQVGAEVCVVDVGVATDLPATPGLLPRKVRAGTSDMTTGPAMTREEAKQAIEVGIETARDLVAAGNKALLTGEMGIANTTASAALISVFTDTDPADVTGRGTGINDETLARKTEVVRRAIELHQPDPADPIGVLAAIGGFEHAAMVGLLLGGASLRTPVILDGVSAGAAALVARAIAPEVLAACIAGHRSAEPGHVAALNKLGLRPLVDLDLRLGEGTGALLALPLVQSTARAMHEVATFDSAGVTEK
ncbi:nicotinate-nucleotide--dimethylbenzimidazole phosphoribosyltransferase [Streptomyces sp. YU58]|uniref:nicotinate-nucleotide--dimethylbenzimidazole phosphoribosyltransferase n=1 Tax=Streptomyces sp. SX92 TaxID=3158972 RepID=UPI0027B9FBF1|nr:nicotinate-nucleotide--dimethylbenzimidazole phosphoribosyltransferase [Streptomyces coralus]WLW56412.1 nicotinate-nucleotide--dimethylbenzimidazole phosphoribosyltransferase [Streptomyces coralus]